MFVVFDLDGTLADIRHRLHFLDRKDWTSFFAACVDDLPNVPVIEALVAHLNAGHRVEIWSARSDEVRAQTESWLDLHGLDRALLTHMRSAGDFTPDVELKRRWLLALHPDERPDAIYDDRQRVVDMWRAEGIACFQVAPNWEAPERTIASICDPLLTIMVGPSGGGKSRWVQMNMRGDWDVIASDTLRWNYTGSEQDQSRNEDVFFALHKLASARLECGLPTIVDATNLRRKDRLACVALAAGVGIRYVVCNRPVADKVRDGGWRNSVMLGDTPLILAHEQRFRSQLKDILRGDDLPQVTVLDTRADANLKVAA